MKTLLFVLLHFIKSFFRSRLSLQAENLALRHQLAVYQRTNKRPRLRPADRFLWSWLSCLWSGWKEALLIVQPATVIKWQKKRFRDYWSRLSRNGKPGRPKIPKELRDLIRDMSVANPLWGSPRIQGELKKLGIEVAKSTVEKYMVKVPKPPSQTWCKFLKNHMSELVSIDFLVVPTVRFKI